MNEKWPSRRFPFDYPVDRIDVILERLRGLLPRVEAKIAGVPTTVLVHRVGETWSIQENIGHLTDLEALHAGRLDDFAAGLPELRGADMTNAGTWSANHNAKPIETVLADLRSARTHFLARIESFPRAELGSTALHPRLQVPMRIVDLAMFVAEHDDYHLARVHELLKLLRPYA